MFKSLNLKTLLILLAVVLGLYFAADYFDSSERSFKKNLTNFDVNTITKVVYSKKAGENIVLNRENDTWYVSKGQERHEADSNRIRQVLSRINHLKTKHVAGQNDQSREKYLVTDSTATFVEVYSGNKKTAGIYIGKFSYQQPENAQPNQMGRQPRGTMTTYVRLEKDKVVYAVDGFLSMAFPEKIDEFRNRTILKINKNNLTAVRYEGEKSYSLNKNRNQWMLNDKPADSAKVEKYINKLVQVAGRNFADGFVGGNTPDKTITLSLTNQEPVIVKAFKTDSSYVVHSSQNKKAYFVADESIMQRIFQQADELQ